MREPSLTTVEWGEVPHISTQLSNTLHWLQEGEGERQLLQTLKGHGYWHRPKYM